MTIESFSVIKTTKLVVTTESFSVIKTTKLAVNREMRSAIPKPSKSLKLQSWGNGSLKSLPSHTASSSAGKVQTGRSLGLSGQPPDQLGQGK